MELDTEDATERCTAAREPERAKANAFDSSAAGENGTGVSFESQCSMLGSQCWISLAALFCLSRIKHPVSSRSMTKSESSIENLCVIRVHLWLIEP